MTRRQSIWTITLLAFLVCAVLILSTAYSQGADPLHPRSRHIWALSLLAAAYVSYRGAIIFENLRNPAEGKAAGGAGRLLRLFRTKEHPIDRRMAARRARVAAARERARPEQREEEGHDHE